ncbi:MAG: FliM/FliN family flagellar motor switch protein [Candidatus Hydrogenedentales bacterium]|jgi:flagellar motor switch protein FliN
MQAEAKQPHEHEFREVNPEGVYGTERVSLDDLREVKMSLTAHLGYCSMTVREILGLRRGSVISLDRQAGEMADIYVNELPLARGEVVVIADVLHVRIGEIIGQEDRSGLEEAHEDAANK